ncbi:MAG: peptidoglycan-binding protein [Alphaproteobacteria bacterium]|nr:peptidoglycan-binding protein [Alphaproteobacteria bacterium]
MRRLILGTASVLALGIAGAALDYSADAGDSPNAGWNTPAMSSYPWLDAAKLSKDDIRWAQLELHNMGLYNGSLDGVVGSQTKQALGRFQKLNGLDRTAALDPQTLDALFGKPNYGVGSSVPANNKGTGSTSSSGGSDLGAPITPK